MSGYLKNEAQSSVTLLSETFDSENGWDEVSDFVHLAKLVRGDYLIRNRHNETWFITDKLVRFDPNENFSFEAVFQKKTGINRDGFGISWGRKEGNNAYSFTISTGGSFEIGKWDFDKWIYLTRKNSDYINKGKKENKLTVRKIDTEYHFFINDSLVEKKNYEPLPGTKVGFIIYNRFTIAVKKLKIKGSPQVKEMSSISGARKSFQVKDTLVHKEDEIGTKQKVADEVVHLVKKPINRKERLIQIESDGRFIIANTGIYDQSSRSGSFTVGNGNGKLEKGEAVKLELSLINNGRSISKGELNVDLEDRNGGYMLVNPENKFTISNLDQSEILKISFVVFVARKYMKDNIKLNVQLMDSSDGRISLTVPVE
jgi:hypothetical protein